MSLLGDSFRETSVYLRGSWMGSPSSVFTQWQNPGSGWAFVRYRILEIAPRECTRSDVLGSGECHTCHCRRKRRYQHLRRQDGEGTATDRHTSTKAGNYRLVFRWKKDRGASRLGRVSHLGRGWGYATAPDRRLCELSCLVAARKHAGRN